jgi:streptomycin 6-kinase
LTLDIHLARWDLVPDGEPIETPSSLLLAVRHNGVPAMLKIAREEDERRGGALMAWWMAMARRRFSLGTARRCCWSIFLI